MKKLLSRPKLPPSFASCAAFAADYDKNTEQKTKGEQMKKMCFTAPFAVALSLSAADIGSVLQEIKPPPPLPPTERPKDVGIKVPPEPEMKADSKTTLRVESFKVEGGDVIDQSLVQKALEPYKRRDLNMAQINEACKAAAQVYRAAGYPMAQVYVPKQDAIGGELRLIAVIGAFGEYKFDNRSLVDDDVWDDLFGKLIEGHKIITYKDSERFTLLASDLAGVKTPTIAVTRGSEFGYSDIVADIEGENRFSGYAIADNYGSRYTGRTRYMASLETRSPLGIGDRLTAGLMTTEKSGIRNANLGYEAPIGNDGLKGGLTASYVQYELGDAFSDLDATGEAAIANVFLSYPILRSATSNLYIRLDINGKKMKDRIGEFDYKLPKEAFSGVLKFSWDKWATLFDRNLYLSADYGATIGHLSVTDDEMREANKAGADTTGDFAYMSAEFGARYNFADNFVASLSVLAQRTGGKNLDNGEQMSISGAFGVRGYREQISGDNGLLALADITYRLPSFGDFDHTIGLFGGVGSVDYADSSYAAEDTRRLSDIGLSYTFTYKALYVKASAAYAQRKNVEKEKDGDTHALFQAGARF
jgi:hemolysin activation/secretion protein